MSSECSACKKPFAQSEISVSCTECESVFHAGTCCDVSHRLSRSKSDSIRDSWKCTACRGNQNKQTDHHYDHAFIASTLSSINDKLEQLMPLKGTVLEVERSIEHMPKKFDDVMEKLNGQERDIAALRKRVEKIEQENLLENQRKMQDELNDLEWRSRRLNLEFHGIAVTQNESLLQKVNDLASILDVPPLTTTDICAIHRLPAKKGKVPGIIVRYNRQADRDLWLSERKKLREAKHHASIVENLTKRNHELLWITKEWASNNSYRFAWHADGKIFLRKDTGELKVHVKSERCWTGS